MRILILGGDGYLGWPTAMYLSRRGHDVGVVDGFHKRLWEMRLGVRPLVAPPLLQERVGIWAECSGRDIDCWIGDLMDRGFVDHVLREFEPDAIVHYGEQPSAPFSMIDGYHATLTQTNNVVGTLNVIHAMRALCPDAHLVKLGTMGEYGTPDIDIEEGYLEVEHKGRRDRLPYPKQPGSFYHLSKVHDSHNLLFACRTWGLRVTDLNQGIVYGVETDETELDPRLGTSFHYDAVFGTALNRFCVEAALGVPLTVYGSGTQQRAFLNIRDTLRCVELAILHPAEPGDFRVFNQFTEQFTILQLAELVVRAAERLGLHADIAFLPNPRVEKEGHYYRAVNSGLLNLGLQPHRLSEELARSMLRYILDRLEHGLVNRASLLPDIRWQAPSGWTAAAARDGYRVAPPAGAGVADGNGRAEVAAARGQES